MKLTSPAFKNNGMIPSEYTCDGDDVSPELIIESAPRNAKSLALIADDPDAPVGTWVHWVVWNIQVNTKTIPKNVSFLKRLNFLVTLLSNFKIQTFVLLNIFSE